MKCITCGKEKDEQSFHKHPTRGRIRNCTVCTNARRRELYAANVSNVECTRRRRSDVAMSNRYMRNFGMTKYEVDAKLSEIGVCEICGGTDRLVPDHCHRTKTFRGVLCDSCNKTLGVMKEDGARLRRAADYLEERKCLPKNG